MIILRRFVVLRNKCYIPEILEKYPNGKPMPFDYDDRDDIFLYIAEKYGNKKSPENLPYAYQVVNIGGIKGVSKKHCGLIFFPGYDKEGAKLDLGYYGQLRHYKENIYKGK